jgi:crotonobetainyl-CoA:carnitine CoA-transferase CaiB-like acyl-CoA transferase
VALGGVEHKFVENFLNAVNRPDLIPAATGPNGPGQAPVKAALRDLFLTRTRDDWVEWARGRDIAFAAVLDLKEAFDQPQVAARQMLLRDEGGNPHIGTPVKYRDEPGQPDLRLPALDEHGPQYRR